MPPQHPTRIATGSLHQTACALIGAFLLVGVTDPVAAQCTPMRSDYSTFVDCLSGPETTPSPIPPMTVQTCLNVFDFDGDLDVDMADFAEFQTTYTGPTPSRCYNVVFVSSRTFATNLGNAFAYDVQCNTLATAAGLNNNTNNAFIAWMSDINSNARLRLGAIARGFARVDGVPFADTQASLVNGLVLNPTRLNEFGNDAGTAFIMTGTNADGTTSASTCTNWTVNSGALATTGISAGGPGAWTARQQMQCSQGPFRIYCVQKTMNAALTPQLASGKLVFLTNTTLLPGAGQTPDQLCDAEKPPGVGTVRALVARTTFPASAWLNPAALYVRLDGQIVGTGAELITLSNLRSGIWQAGDGLYPPLAFVWTGAVNLTDLGTIASTCNNWTVSAGTGEVGFSSTAQAPEWWSSTTRGCNEASRIYCVEQ